MKQIGLGTMMYAGDYDDVMPYGAYWRNIPSVGDRLITWRINTMPYIKNLDIFSPPGFKKGQEAGSVRLDYTSWYEDYRQNIPLGVAGIHSWAHPDFARSGLNLSEVPRTAGLISVVTSRFQFADVATWTVNKTWYNGAPQYPGKGTYVAYAGKVNFAFYDGHARSMNPCSTFGNLAWLPGEVPADDFLWEWWAGPDSNVLRDWKQGAQPGYQANDYGCQDIDEYR
jgi:prepilin-type processing-associated H-X9-DG protein